jgi:hypothetical protein
LIIDEVDVEGKFIRLTNKGIEDISIGNWLIRSTAGDQETTFKFHSRAKVQAGQHVTVIFYSCYNYFFPFWFYLIFFYFTFLRSGPVMQMLNINHQLVIS